MVIRLICRYIIDELTYIITLSSCDDAPNTNVKNTFVFYAPHSHIHTYTHTHIHHAHMHHTHTYICIQRIVALSIGKGHLAPEVESGDAASFMSDMWSYGCVCVSSVCVRVCVYA